MPQQAKAADVISGQEVCGFCAKEAEHKADWLLTHQCLREVCGFGWQVTNLKKKDDKVLQLHKMILPQIVAVFEYFSRHNAKWYLCKSVHIQVLPT